MKDLPVEEIAEGNLKSTLIKPHGGPSLSVTALL